MRRSRTVPLRLWLTVLVFALVAGIAVAEIALSQSMSAWQQHADSSRIAAIRRIIGTDAAQWQNRTWQQHADSALKALSVETEIIRLTSPRSGIVAYTTPGAVSLLGPIGHGLLQQKAYTSQGPMSELIPAGGTLAPTFEKILIPNGATGSRIRGVSILLFTGPAPGSPSVWLWPEAALLAVVLILAVAIWLFGRSVLRPLAALDRAVAGIAGGDLDVHLPRSSAREVAEVSAAVEGMSAALRESLTRQNAVEEERRLFIGAVAHDLRTPLFMLRGYLKGLQSGVAATPEKRAQYVDSCLAKADALEHLISDLFDFTRLEYLDQEPARQPLELGGLLEASTQGARPAAEAKGIRIVLLPAEGLCPLEGDSHLLGRAVENLLDNALRYTPEGGEIRVAWACDGETARFSVSDTGSGIAEQDLPHIFTPLYRAETSRNRQTGGAGLGLAIADRILRSHGGSITATNDPHSGAVFTGVLPTATRVLPVSAVLTSTG
jgi:signal transduction histidine kinase